MNRCSIATVSLSGDLDEKLAAIAAAGFQAVEIFETDFLAFDAGAAEVGQMVRDAGLTVSVFQPFRDFEGLPEPLRARAFERAERKFEVMEALGAELLLICSSLSPQALGGIDRAADDLRALGERAAARGLRIGYEALAWGRHVNDHRDAWEVVRRADHPAVGLVLDSFHTLARGLDPDSIRRVPGDRIFLVQLADAPRLDMDLLSWSRHFRCLPGQGDLPLARFLEAVAATGYDGHLSLEIFNDRFRAGSPRQVALDGRRSLIRLGEVAGVSLQPPAPGPAVPLPPRVDCEAVAFVEFAADEATAAELTRLLAALGFRYAGRHRSKAVTLWRQGTINLVVNCEMEGFAHAFFVTHGPAVCAIGLAVTDAAAALARAQGLLLQGFSQPVGPGELEIPAIRGVGGSLLYLLEREEARGRVWENDFHLEPQAVGAAAELTRVDHLAQSMTNEEQMSWLLTYSALFRLEKSPQVEIADPGGLVHSQVVQSPDRAVRIVLNSSESPKTLSRRFLEELFGSGLQHIAFHCHDIFAAAAGMARRGLVLLAIPANYYEDLEARFALEPALLRRMRQHGVLYDRDAEGEYFQIYSRSFADRFFFEVVERRGGYGAFGAGNAAIRLAAQARGAGRGSL